MEIDGNLLLRALCLAIIMESILLFISPATARRVAEQIAVTDERLLRVLGAGMMLFGLLALTWLAA